ncbi:BhlA/UviB family holin-like peptide [Lysinibacillus sp. NPDC093712]|uniref:BhlA/UviB family holin-like peptide n=1 Tax=Lysinibacillus sp. NPDC093712 TaxID=3390579 RepID=UPI003D0526B8
MRWFFLLGQRIGDGMDVAAVNEIATSQAVWAIACLIIAFGAFRYLISKNDNLMNRAEERENKLMDHLERSNESQERTAIALEGMNRSLNVLEGRVDRIEKYSLKNKNNEKDDE